MKIFVINLEQSRDRRKFMKDQLESLRMDAEFWPAVNGRQLTQEQLATMCDADQIKRWPDLLTPGMLGCSLSHYFIYQEIIRKNIPYALVLEDDVLLPRDFKGLLEKIENNFVNGSLKEDEVLSLYFQKDHVINFRSEGQVQIDSKHTANYPVEVWEMNTTSAYVISKKSAERLSDFIFPIKFPPDCWGEFKNAGALPGMRCVLPLPVQSGYFKSDIGYELDHVFKNLIRLLEKHNVFPVKQILRRRRRERALYLNRYSVLSDSQLSTRE